MMGFFPLCDTCCILNWRWQKEYKNKNGKKKKRIGDLKVLAGILLLEKGQKSFSSGFKVELDQEHVIEL